LGSTTPPPKKKKNKNGGGGENTESATQGAEPPTKPEGNPHKKKGAKGGGRHPKGVKQKGESPRHPQAPGQARQKKKNTEGGGGEKACNVRDQGGRKFKGQRGTTGDTSLDKKEAGTRGEDHKSDGTPKREPTKSDVGGGGRLGSQRRNEADPEPKNTGKGGVLGREDEKKDPVKKGGKNTWDKRRRNWKEGGSGAQKEGASSPGKKRIGMYKQEVEKERGGSKGKEGTEEERNKLQAKQGFPRTG